MVPAPQFEICSPHFIFGSLVVAYIQYRIFKMWPLLVYGPPAAKSWRRACFTGQIWPVGRSSETSGLYDV